jgi:hypothetical protein
MKRWTLVIALVASTAAPTFGEAILWDNNLTTNGVSGRATSPPHYPNIRIAEDVLVPEGQEWTIDAFAFAVLHASNWRSRGVGEMFVYADRDGAPGARQLNFEADLREVATGDTYYGRDSYHFWIEGFEPVVLGAGRHWIGFRCPRPSGDDNAWWMTSDGGPDGRSSSTAYLSLDEGQTWEHLGEGWHLGFVVSGVPEPSGVTMLVVGAAMLLARRRPLTTRLVRPVRERP